MNNYFEKFFTYAIIFIFLLKIHILTTFDDSIKFLIFYGNATPFIKSFMFKSTNLEGLPFLQLYRMISLFKITLIIFIKILIGYKFIRLLFLNINV